RAARSPRGPRPRSTRSTDRSCAGRLDSRADLGQSLEDRVEPILEPFDLLLHLHELRRQADDLAAGGDAERRERGFGLLLGRLLGRRRGMEEGLELLAHRFREGLGRHRLLEHLRPGSDPLIEELLPLRHEIGRRRTLRHHLRPGGHVLIHERPPERLRIDRLTLPEHLEPGLARVFRLLLPQIEELLGRVVRHLAPPWVTLMIARRARRPPSASNGPRLLVPRSARCVRQAIPRILCRGCSRPRSTASRNRVARCCPPWRRSRAPDTRCARAAPTGRPSSVPL